MKAFTEVKQIESSVILMFTPEEGKILLKALEQYSNENKRFLKAKKLLQEFYSKVEIF